MADKNLLKKLKEMPASGFSSMMHNQIDWYDNQNDIKNLLHTDDAAKIIALVGNEMVGEGDVLDSVFQRSFQLFLVIQFWFQLLTISFHSIFVFNVQELYDYQFESISSAFCNACVSATDRYDFLGNSLDNWLTLAHGTPSSVRVRVFDKLFIKLWVQIRFDF